MSRVMVIPQWDKYGDTFGGGFPLTEETTGFVEGHELVLGAIKEHLEQFEHGEKESPPGGYIIFDIDTRTARYIPITYQPRKFVVGVPQ